MFYHVWKRWGPTNDEDPSNKILKIYRLPPLPPTSPTLDNSMTRWPDFMIRCLHRFSWIPDDFMTFHRFPWISGVRGHTACATICKRTKKPLLEPSWLLFHGFSWISKDFTRFHRISRISTHFRGPRSNRMWRPLQTECCP